MKRCSNPILRFVLNALSGFGFVHLSRVVQKHLFLCNGTEGPITPQLDPKQSAQYGAVGAPATLKVGSSDGFGRPDASTTIDSLRARETSSRRGYKAFLFGPPPGDVWIHSHKGDGFHVFVDREDAKRYIAGSEFGCVREVECQQVSKVFEDPNGNAFLAQYIRVRES